MTEGQDEVPGTLQFPQCFVTAPDLVSPPCIVKIEMLAQRPAQRGAISVDLAGELAANERDRFGLPQGSFDLVLLVHLCRISRMTTKV
jgi:hypothetical protein